MARDLVYLAFLIVSYAQRRYSTGFNFCVACIAYKGIRYLGLVTCGFNFHKLMQAGNLQDNLFLAFFFPFRGSSFAGLVKCRNRGVSRLRGSLSLAHIHVASYNNYLLVHVIHYTEDCLKSIYFDFFAALIE